MSTPSVNFLYLMVSEIQTLKQYSVFHLVVVQTTKSAKNNWEPVVENTIILGSIIPDTTKNVYIWWNMAQFLLYTR